MPIDRIGKGGGAPPGVPGAAGPSGPTPTKAFEVERPEGATTVGEAGAKRGADAAGAVGDASPLEQLRAGKIDVQQYVELKLDEATAHLKGLRPAEIEHIRETLRDKIAQDPHLVELVRHATGHMPTPPEE
jgi:hypothetical protein